MKKLPICILLLLSSLVNKIGACSFYPYGVSYKFICSENVGLYEYSEFDYSSGHFYSNNIIDSEGNVDLWFQYLNEKISKKTIKEAVYTIPFYEFNKDSHNAMIEYLYKQKDVETISYLKFAKECESFNRVYKDPWERKSNASFDRGVVIRKAEEAANIVTKNALKKRYIFLAIRMAFYNNDEEAIIRLFDTYFKDNKNKDLIYYWSLYFRTKFEKDNALQSYYAAQVFANSEEKRFNAFKNFNFEINENDILKYAKNNREKGNIYALIGIKKYAKALKDIERLATIDSSNKLLPFLMLREVNKLEDWILTPYFSLFNPLLSETKRQEKYNDSFSYVKIQTRIKKDRLYAKKLLVFIDSLPKTIKNKTVWRLLEIQLQYLTKNYSGALKNISLIGIDFEKESDVYFQLEQTKTLCELASQQSGKAKITEEIKGVILKYQENKSFIFAIGRELEYKGNKIEAALIYAALRGAKNNDSNTWVSWKTPKNKRHSYRDYFDNYFDYINVMYTVEEVEEIITMVLENKDDNDEFSKWKYAIIKKEIPKLYDLVGTMYIRRDELKKALTYFNKLDDDYWDKTAWLWGKRDRNGERYFENPFYTINYTGSFPEKEEEKIELNKKTVTAKLVAYLEKTKTVKNKDYYYFLIGNCYYNMTYFGNSWMMRRFGVSAYDTEPFPEDEKEYREGHLAKKYYLLASKYANNKDFKTLCLFMVGRCERMEKIGKSNQGRQDLRSYHSLFHMNSDYKGSNTPHQEYYEEVSCGIDYYYKPSSEN